MTHTVEHLVTRGHHPNTTSGDTGQPPDHLALKEGEKVKSLQMYGLVKKADWLKFEFPALPSGVDIGCNIDNKKAYGLYDKFKTQMEISKLSS